MNARNSTTVVFALITAIMMITPAYAVVSTDNVYADIADARTLGVPGTTTNPSEVWTSDGGFVNYMRFPIKFIFVLE